MPVNLSDGAKAHFAPRFASMFNGGRIDVFSGSQPESANLAPTGTLLATITAPSGLSFYTAGTYAIKVPDEVWTLDGIATGIAGWWRLYGPTPDGGGVSTAARRLDGAVYSLEDPHTGLLLPDLNITAATSRVVEQFLFML